LETRPAHAPAADHTTLAYLSSPARGSKESKTIQLIQCSIFVTKLEIEISKIKQQTKETELEPDKETEPEPENIIEPTKPPMEILKQQPQKKQGFQRDRQSGFFIL
jgi:hypothetical protein